MPFTINFYIHYYRLMSLGQAIRVIYTDPHRICHGPDCCQMCTVCCNSAICEKIFAYIIGIWYLAKLKKLYITTELHVNQPIKLDSIVSPRFICINCSLNNFFCPIAQKIL